MKYVLVALAALAGWFATWFLLAGVWAVAFDLSDELAIGLGVISGLLGFFSAIIAGGLVLALFERREAGR